MKCVLVGIDEAGYGPLLGPLCVASAAFEVTSDAHGTDDAPDLWAALSEAVCRSPRDKRGRIAVDDSKKLKAAGDGPGDHAQVRHLERGVLAFLLAGREDGETGFDGNRLTNPPWIEEHLLAALGVVDHVEPGTLGARGLAQTDADAGGPAGEGVSCAPIWAGSGAGESSLPRCLGADQLRLTANMLRTACARAGVRCVALRCRVMHEAEFNRVVGESGSKGETTAACVCEHLVWARRAFGGAGVSLGSLPAGRMEREQRAPIRVSCDRLGGRTAYSGMLSRAFAGESVTTLEQGAEESVYEIGRGGGRAMRVEFRSRGESSSMAVALASMTAKFVRELYMRRFNRYWAARLPGVRATAGYATDARRWLDEAGGVLTPEERAGLVRVR